MTLDEILTELEALRDQCKWRKNSSGAIIGEDPKGATASAPVILWRIKNGHAGPHFPGNVPDMDALAAMELGLAREQAESLAMACNNIRVPHRARILHACGLSADE